MKQRLLTIGLLAFISLSLTAQEFISEDKQWNVRLSSFMVPTTEIYVIEGDSVHNSINYKKIWMTFDSTLTGLMFQGLVREENNVVYYVPPGGTEGTLYDFNLQVGDSIWVKNMFCADMELQAMVIAVDTVEYSGVERKRWLLESDGWTEYWVEGMGSMSGPLHTLYPLCIICPVWELLCFHENDTLLYIMPGQEDCFQTSVGIEDKLTDAHFKITPNPVAQGQPVEVQTSRAIKSAGIFNSSGILIKKVFPPPHQRIVFETDQLRPGLYLIRIEILSNQMRTVKLVVL